MRLRIHVPLRNQTLRRGFLGSPSSIRRRLLREYQCHHVRRPVLRPGRMRNPSLAGGLPPRPFHQLLQHFGRLDTPDILNVSTSDRLTPGDNGQRLHHGIGQFRPSLPVVKPVKPVCQYRSSHQTIARRDLLDPKGATGFVVRPVQPVDKFARFGRISECGKLRQPTQREGSVGHEEHGFQPCHLSGASAWTPP